MAYRDSLEECEEDDLFITEEMVERLLAWNEQLMPAGEDEMLAVPYDGWHENWFADTPPAKRSLLQKITEQVRSWLEAQNGSSCVFFNGDEGVTVMVGHTDYYLSHPEPDEDEVDDAKPTIERVMH